MESRPSLPWAASMSPMLAVALLVGWLSGGTGGRTVAPQTPAPVASDSAPLAQSGQTSSSTQAPPPQSSSSAGSGNEAVTTAWLDGRIAGSDSARAIHDYLADIGCRSAAAGLQAMIRAARKDGQLRAGVAGPRPVAPALAGLPEMACEVRPIVVALADYAESNSRWQADRSLATIQSAVGAAEFTLERFHLPGSPRPSADAAAPVEPGVLLFRHLPLDVAAGLRQSTPLRADSARMRVLVLLTVPEMPTSGLERLPLLMAMRLALTLGPTPGADGPMRRLDVIGPSYSGSTLSLLRGLEELAAVGAEDGPVAARVVSGSATSASNCALLAGPLPHGGRVTFQRTVHEDATLLLALQRHLATIRPEWVDGTGVALLIESNTGWGVSLNQPAATAKASPAAASSPDPSCIPPSASSAPRALTLHDRALKLGFPLHISDRSAARKRTTPGLPQYAQLLAPVEMLRFDDSITPTDRLPTFTPFMTDAARDLMLDNILSQLQRRHVGAVGILGTDFRDHLFLAREINRVSPDVVMFGTEPDILMLHGEYQPYVRGTLMASSYPMQSHAQVLTHSDRASHGRELHHYRVQFTSMAQQGLYNAMLVVLGVPELLLDYRGPPTGGFEARAPRPVPWVIAAGQGEFLPVAAYPDLVSPQDIALMPEGPAEHVIAATAQADTTGSAATHAHDEASSHAVGDGVQDEYLFASAQERVMWMLPGLVALIALGVCVLARIRPLATARWLSPPAVVDRELQEFVRGDAARARGLAPRRTEQEALRLEHDVLWLATALSLAVFMAWHLHMWVGATPHGVLPTYGARAVGLFTVAVAFLLLWVGARRFAVVTAGRVARGSRLSRRVRASLRASAPEAITVLVLAVGVLFVVGMAVYVWPLTDPQAAVALFASARAFNLTSLLSVAPVLALLPLLVLTWTIWSLRTLYYQRISPTRAMPLVHALVSADVEDRRLEHALASTVGTTMQPAGAYLLLPAATVLVIWLLLTPRIASLEGRDFGWLLMVGTTLGALAATLELAQAAWLANRVTRLLERVRIHPLASDIETMRTQPFDWRPALQPPPAAHRLLLRALRDLGESVPPDSDVVAQHDRTPVLRTQAWHRALVVAGRRLVHSRTAGTDLEPAARTVIALVVSLLLQALVTRVVRGFGIASGLVLLLMAAHLLTAFSGRSLALIIDLGLLMATAVLAIRALIAFEKDYVLSQLWHGTPGRLNLSSGLVWRAVVYAGLPLLTVLAARFPEVGGKLITVVEPLRHLLPMP